ncbi:putative amidohydrolase [Roseivirga pacifica]|uniref:Predicted amidohydrolase n=1 Tax=Roseivirga pacifica TaxID=1267423 RepID=A0A1I0M907_9BACT|nr:bifunctional GNAT family N-acetyltransferase/carbon-nitrogen hydrolase family protein [Roseivirga pacifica]RKQ50184.1 putative amidohydrolase [Roseivirga pacifica]SEV84802.1 Predicted amidohydrolase [Roseivirga pacifica]
MKEIQKIELRHLELSDFANLQESMHEAYSNWTGDFWNKGHIQKLIDVFPEGQLVILADGQIAGCALSLILDYKKYGDNHTYAQVTGNYTFSTHDSKGNVLYGIEMFIKPEFRGMRLGRRLYDARKELCESLNLEAIMFGGRIPNYHKFSKELRPSQYIKKVQQLEIHDPTLNFQLSNDFHVLKVLRNYMPDDAESKEFAVLMEWNNINYEENDDKINLPKTVVRLGLIQWQMRLYNGIGELFDQVEFFVDAVASYKSDFVLFPEFFNAPLMAEYNDLTEAQAIRKLAEYTDEIRERFSRLAITYNVNIITGSMPKLEGQTLNNVGFLCRRDGTYEQYTKLHVTPDEEKYWGLTGGNEIKVFETDCGPIGILICYDVEFPELPRILAEQGMNILFVPFLTDTQNGYSRVRYCARARAIENECYVAIAGSVGNLPKVENMDIQFAQSVVFTPCDFAFPTTGIKAEATPNTEMILVADVDMDLLWELHNNGAVRNLKDRRKDLYDVITKRSL